MKYINPIIRGFYPDPSICYVDGFYYIVCSSFEYFPGLPIFKSKDLISWELIGHCITRKSQVNLSSIGASEGLFAPTIRYHNKRFYVVVTDISGIGNFYVYTDNIMGEWSEPILVKRSGIDPSLLFDGEKTYFMSNGEDDYGVNGISLCEIEIETGEVLTKSRCISQGTGGRYIEAPHLYHIGEYYYLLVAEGGTEYGHMECMLRSKEIYGPYESYSKNPILTNRNLGDYFIQGAGHADIIQAQDGQWWMVHLAFRQIHKWKPFHHLGREVFLEPIFWTDDGWLRVGTDGTSRAMYEIENGVCKMYETADYPSYHWSLKKEKACFLRSPDYNNYRYDSVTEFSLKGVIDNLNSRGNVTFIGMRQEEFEGIAEIGIDVTTMIEGQHAGITVYMNEESHYDLFVKKDIDRCHIICEAYIGNMRVDMGNIEINGKEAILRMESNREYYKFYAKNDYGNNTLLSNAKTKYLSSEVTEGFTGVIIAAYCIANSEGKSEFVKYRIY